MGYHHTLLVPIMLFGWIPFVLMLFGLIATPRRAVIVAYLFGLLFLPSYGYVIPGLPNYTKMTATSVGVLLGILMVDHAVITRFRPSWVDLPMFIFCLSPAMASLANGLGAYDAMSGAVHHLILWGLPFFIGRIYFNNIPALRELAIGIFIGGLIYTPLCLWEVRMSPQLNYEVYGFYAAPFREALRWGGFRPLVFMHDGLMLSMWMAMSGLLGWWLWVGGRLKAIWGIPTGLLAAAVIVTAVLCRSTGAVILLVAGLSTLFCLKFLRTRLLIVLIIVAPLVYVGLRATQTWSLKHVVEVVHDLNPRRAQSLEFRLVNEDRLAQKALQRPIFGWGGYGRSRVHNSITDGLWIITLGKTGFVGLAGLLGFLLLPMVVMLIRLPRSALLDPAWAAPVGIGIVLVLHMIDSLMNAFINPLFVLAAGGATGIAAILVRRHKPVLAPVRRLPPRQVDDASALAPGCETEVTP